MKRRSIVFILLLSFILSVSGCGGSPKADASIPETASDATAENETSATAESAPAEEEAVLEKGTDSDTDGSTPPTPELKEAIETQQAADIEENVEDAVGIFEGLEDNHTAIFSFDGAESAFYFEEPAVRTVLNEAVTGSSYTFSYQFNASLGLDCIYEITEN